MYYGVQIRKVFVQIIYIAQKSDANTDERGNTSKGLWVNFVSSYTTHTYTRFYSTPNENLLWVHVASESDFSSLLYGYYFTVSSTTNTNFYKDVKQMEYDNDEH